MRRTITAALHDAGIIGALSLEGLDEKERRLILSIPAEAENTLEEFAWAFGDDTVAQIEKRCIMSCKASTTCRIWKN